MKTFIIFASVLCIQNCALNLEERGKMFKNFNSNIEVRFKAPFINFLQMLVAGFRASKNGGFLILLCPLINTNGNNKSSLNIGRFNLKEVKLKTTNRKSCAAYSGNRKRNEPKQISLPLRIGMMFRHSVDGTKVSTQRNTGVADKGVML